MSDERKLLCSWYTPDIVDGQVEHLMEEYEMSEDEARADAWADHDLFYHEYDYFKDHLTEVLEERGLDTVPLRVNGFNMTWQNLEGYKVIFAGTGKELLDEILPDTECYIWVYEFMKDVGIQMKVSHHDSPMGETYIIQDVEDRYCENCEEVFDDPGHMASIKEERVCLDCYFGDGEYCEWCNDFIICSSFFSSRAPYPDGVPLLLCSTKCEHEHNVDETKKRLWSTLEVA